METIGYATYSPEDNKIRVYPASRLPRPVYDRLKSAGFKWAPKQELFVAPMWTPEREDLAEELCGELRDEDTSLADRQEQRADRFAGYQESRLADARQARERVEEISNGIPMGQPILVGHHSERHARMHAEQIESGMRKAVKMWRTAEYWTSRAAGAIRHAKYKELPAVRARRIKGIEADKRKQERHLAELRKNLELWSKPDLTREQALAIANYECVRGCTLANGQRVWSAWSAIQDGKIEFTEVAKQRAKAFPPMADHYGRWIEHYDNRLAYERAMLADAGGIVADKIGPEKGGACKCWASPGYGRGWSFIKKVNKVSVTVEDNWDNGGKNFTRTIPFDKLAAIMSAADVQAARNDGRLFPNESGTGFFLNEKPETRSESAIRVHKEATATKPEEEAAFKAIGDSLKAGVQTVSAPQLFPTPASLARQLVDMADIRPGHDVLEPSAGTGRLLDQLYNDDGTAIVNEGGKLVAVEVNCKLASRLRAAYANAEIVNGDFLATNGDIGQFDRIVMNPPFEKGSDIKHVRHAIGKLKSGGRLAAIVANGPRQRKELADADEWIDLPAGSFVSEGTSVNAAIIVFNR